MGEGLHRRRSGHDGRSGKCRRQQVVALQRHDHRRSAIRNMIAEGNPENWCMAISGHKTASVFRRYAIVSTADITTAMQRVEAVTLKASSKKIGVKSMKNLPAAKQGRV